MRKIKTRKSRLKSWGLFKLGMVLILGIIVFGWSKGKVDAGIYDSSVMKERVKNIYAVAEIEGQKKIFYLDMYYMAGKVSYCLDVGCEIVNTKVHSTSDFSISNLTKEQVEYIKSVAYFGYLYMSHNDTYYYAAAQELIWEYVNGIDVYWTKEYDVNGSRIYVETYKETILRKIADYHKKIDFSYEFGQVYRVSDEIIVEDLNGVLRHYDIVSRYSEVSVDGNFLTIKIGDEAGSERIEFKRKGYYGCENLLYYDDKSQMLVSYGDYREVDTVVSFEIKGVSVVGQVVGTNDALFDSSEASLEAAVYELYSEDGDLLGSYESDENGYFEVNNLAYGNYYFKQIKASQGYLVSEEEIEFVVDNDDVEVSLEQELITNMIMINKVYGSEDEYKPEKGILFYIYNSNDEVVYEGVTDDVGIIKVNLPYGKYRLEQQNTTSGYSKVQDFWIEVIEEKEENIYYNLINELILVKVEISTFAKENNEVLVSNDIAYRINLVNENTYLEFNGEDIFYVGDDGVISIPVMLGYGDYILEQVSVPKGVVLSKEAIKFSINDNSKLELVDGNIIMKLDIYNDLVKGKVKIKAFEEIYYKKSNEYGFDRVVRENVEFILKAQDDIVANGKVIYQSGEDVYVGEVLENGELIIDNLYLGSYCLIDNETMEEKCFVIDSNDSKESIVNVNLEFVKTFDKGSIVVENKSSDDKIISGSVFEVIDSEKEVIYTGVTNNYGIIKVEGLLLGNYCIRQKKVDNLYYLLEDEVCFGLEENKVVELVNEEIVNKIISVPNTLEEEKFGIYEMLVVLSLIGTGYIVYKKIFNSKLLS